MTYTVNSMDICTAGHERLRSNSEFLLVTTVYRGVNPADIQADFKHQIQNCAQPDDFDWDGFNRSVEAFISDEIEGRTEDLFGDIDAPGEDGEGCNLYVYMTGPGYADEDE